jgi:hypothetical protein
VSQAAEDPHDDSHLPPAFARAGERFVPSPYACSPWSEQQQHGAAMLGLIARAVELHPSEQPMQVARLSVDMMRAAPMAPVELRCRAIRSGRWVETLEAGIFCGGEQYVHATAMRFRRHALDTSQARPAQAPRARREPSEEWSLPRGIRFFARCVQMNPGEGARGRMVWYRMRVPLVAGEPTSGVQIAAALSDFTYGTPMVIRARSDAHYDPEPGFTAINPDTTVNLLRAPVGDWIGLESQLELGDQGAGVAHATLWDDAGIAGSVSQTVLLRPITSERRLSWRKLRKSGTGH